MMAERSISAKNDTAIEFPIVDENGDAIATSSFTNVTGELINRKTGEILDTFVLNSDGNSKNIVVVNSSKFRLWLEKEIWDNHVDGDLFISIVAYQPNSEITGGFQRTGGIIKLPKLEKNG